MSNLQSPRGLTRRFRLTSAIVAREIRAARSAGQKITVIDTACAGLRLVIGPRSASWSVTSRPRGVDAVGKPHKLKSVVIGEATAIAPEAARQLAIATKRDIALGRDLVAERRERVHQEAQASRTLAYKASADAEMLRQILDPQINSLKQSIYDFGVLTNAPLADCAAAFVIHGAGGGQRHIYHTGHNLERALAEMNAAGLKPHELSKQQIRGLVNLHVKAGRPATGRHRHSAIGRLFKWMQSLDLLEHNPAAAVRAPTPPAPRTNVPTAATVQALWSAADRLPAARASFVKLALLLPLRRQELANLRANNIAFDGTSMEIRLLPSQVKNRTSFTMPLVGTAAAIVRGLLEKARSPDDPLLPLSGPGITFDNWKVINAQVAREAGLHFRWHDTRRLFASELAEHGISNFMMIDALLNHSRSATLSGTARAYHHASERPARIAAMSDWNRLILHAAEHGRWPREMSMDSNVIPIALKGALS